jgi:hypothetical protein
VTDFFLYFEDLISWFCLSLCLGQTDVNSENVQDLLEATNFLQIKDLNQKCSDFMARNLDSSNCVAVLRLADTLSNDTLLQVAEGIWRRSYLCFASILASLVFMLRQYFSFVSSLAALVFLGHPTSFMFTEVAVHISSR